MSAAEQPVSRVPEAPHGTLRGARMGCGCMWCTSAELATTATVSAAKPRVQDARR